MALVTISRQRHSLPCSSLRGTGQAEGALDRPWAIYASSPVLLRRSSTPASFVASEPTVKPPSYAEPRSRHRHGRSSCRLTTSHSPRSRRDRTRREDRHLKFCGLRDKLRAPKPRPLRTGDDQEREQRSSGCLKLRCQSDRGNSKSSSRGARAVVPRTDTPRLPADVETGVLPSMRSRSARTTFIA